MTQRWTVDDIELQVIVLPAAVEDGPAANDTPETDGGKETSNWSPAGCLRDVDMLTSSMAAPLESAVALDILNVTVESGLGMIVIVRPPKVTVTPVCATIAIATTARISRMFLIFMGLFLMLWRHDYYGNSMALRSSPVGSWPA